MVCKTRSEDAHQQQTATKDEVNLLIFSESSGDHNDSLDQKAMNQYHDSTMPQRSHNRMKSFFVNEPSDNKGHHAKQRKYRHHTHINGIFSIAKLFIDHWKYDT